MSTVENLRAANASLLGYHYQLDKALIEILSAVAPEAEIIVEGVEDIDVISGKIYNAIQCKYLEGQKCLPSVLREPIQLMLLEFRKDTSKRWAFKLYAHFGIPSAIPVVNVPTIKSILTYTSKKVERRFYEENGLSDEILEKFLSCFTLIQGPSHEDQQKQVLKLVEKRFGATPTEASHFLYPKALAVVLRTATKPSQQERIVRPELFLEEIRQASTSVISPWLLRVLGPERAYQFIKRAISKSSLFRSSSARTIVVDSDEGSEPGLVQINLCDFLVKLISASFKAGTSLFDAIPWTVVVNTTLDRLATQKRHLLANGIRINDGYEHIQFSPGLFSEPPIVNRMAKNGKSTHKLGRSSYSIRLVTFASIAPHLAALSLGDTLLCTTDPEVQLRISAACGTKVNIGPQWTRSQILGLLKA